MKQKVAILTTFQDFNPGYSLTGIVSDQARMLVEYGHEVHLFVCTQFNPKFPFHDAVNIHKSVPFAHLKDYTSQAQITEEHRKTVQQTKDMVKNEMADMDVVFTHDIVFTGWNLPYCVGVREGSQGLKPKWLHWIHSVPTGLKDWWNIRLFGSNHKLVFPNKTERLFVAEQYRGVIDDVRAIHHIKDPRTWFDFSEDTCAFIKQYSAVMQADVVQVYPASVDRLSAKRVREVILIFSNMKKLGRKICLVIAAQWATGRQQKESVNQYKTIALQNDVDPGTELIFTSDFQSPKFDVGIPRRMLRELMLLSNVFIFPTREESFGLVLPEAGLSGVMPVLNKSLDMMREVGGNCGVYHDFGSHLRQHNIDNEEKYYHDIAFILLGRLQQNESLMSKTFMRQHYNWDYLYRYEYAPVMAETEVWK